MDAKTAKSILTGDKKANHYKRPGSLVSGPDSDPADFVIQLLIAGDEVRPKEPQAGYFPLYDDDFDYVVHNLKGVTLSEKETFYEDYHVTVKVYTLDDGEVSITEFSASEDGWTEI